MWTAQGGYLVFGLLPHWFVFTPWGLAGFIIFTIASLAESNRSPFDIPEAESELIAGHLTEYSGFKYALFFLAEYLGMFAISGLGVTLFLGGWQAPLPGLDVVPSYVWFFTKLISMVLLFIWVRGTVPRLRVDQLLNFAWKFMLPMSLLNLVVTAVWHYTAVWDFSGAIFARWLLCAAMIGLPYVCLGRALSGDKKLTLRTYRLRRLDQMGIVFAIIAALTLVSGIAAMSLRKLIHCALCLAVTFAGLAAMYLQLGAQFVGFAQVLVYIGAVAILVVFAILLTRSGDPVTHPVVSPGSWVVGRGHCGHGFWRADQCDYDQLGGAPGIARQAGPDGQGDRHATDDLLCAAAPGDWPAADGGYNWRGDYCHAGEEEDGAPETARVRSQELAPHGNLRRTSLTLPAEAGHHS